MPVPQHLFRLRLGGSPGGPSRIFRSRRVAFRTALADALIDLRLQHERAPLVLEIARNPTRGRVWLTPHPGAGKEVQFPDPMRWECAGVLYDDLVRVFWANQTKASPASLGNATVALAEG